LILCIKIDAPDQLKQSFLPPVKEAQTMHADVSNVSEILPANSATARSLTRAIGDALALPASSLDRLRIEGSDALPSAFSVTELATATIGAAALAVSELVGLFSAAPAVTVDRRLASLWFGWSIRPLGWEVPPAWDAIAGDYRAADGWIRLHTNAPRHRAAALRVLGCKEERGAVASEVAAWPADALEQAVVSAGGCAAAMRDMQEWASHAQGRAVAAEPLIAFTRTAAAPMEWRPTPGRPLDGLKVLDLTRVLAGPVATRFLAGYGADVLRIDPPGWNEPGVVPEVTLGKRCARLDLHVAADRDTFEHLLAQADALVHGYRPGALDALGYDEGRLRTIRSGLIDVALNAYGWSGPWRMRRGFDSLVQMSAGIAAAGMAWQRTDRPVPLPVQALDHATGYLMAAAVVRGLIDGVRGNGATTARLSLARTALLLGQPVEEVSPAAMPAADVDYAPGEEATSWGPAKRLLGPVISDGAALSWDRGASQLGAAAPSFTQRGVYGGAKAPPVRFLQGPK
jgi:crotonobetainyl-CoA:carnitine CoA-transferase CaiB-like acyl-CoA transferase